MMHPSNTIDVFLKLWVLGLICHCGVFYSLNCCASSLGPRIMTRPGSCAPHPLKTWGPRLKTQRNLQLSVLVVTQVLECSLRCTPHR